VERIAVIGAGRIGLPVAANLVAAGYGVTVHDIRPELSADVEQLGATWAVSGGDAIADADTLLTVLPGSRELAEVMLGGTGLVGALRPGTTWIDLTSATPALGTELVGAAGRAGITFLDAPISGGPAAAVAGTLTFYVGGPVEVYRRHRPLLTVLGDPVRVHRVGGPGAGYLVKLLINSLWFTQLLSLTEVALLGQACGIEADVFDALVASSPAAGAVATDYLPRLRRGDYVADFGLERIVEELDGLDVLAQHLSSPFDISRVTARLHREALSTFGAVDGELLGAAYLERRAGHNLHD
jgi:3-hydroxyisobutyrate dehydrogenase